MTLTLYKYSLQYLFIFLNYHNVLNNSASCFHTDFLSPVPQLILIKSCNSRNDNLHDFDARQNAYYVITVPSALRNGVLEISACYIFLVLLLSAFRFNPNLITLQQCLRLGRPRKSFQQCRSSLTPVPQFFFLKMLPLVFSCVYCHLPPKSILI